MDLTLPQPSEQPSQPPPKARAVGIEYTCSRCGAEYFIRDTLPDPGCPVCLSPDCSMTWVHEDGTRHPPKFRRT